MKDPFSITSWSMAHAGGTKFYNVYVVENLTQEQQVVVFRYGKVGSFGRAETHCFSNSSLAVEFASKKVSDKEKRSYRVSDRLIAKKVDSVGDLARALGASNLPRVLGRGALNHLNLVEESPGAAKARSELQERMRRGEENRLRLEQLQQEAEKKEQAASDAQMRQSNPNWGTF